MKRAFHSAATTLNSAVAASLAPLNRLQANWIRLLTNIALQHGSSSWASARPPTLPQQRIVNTWQAQDNWNWVLGKHQIKAGVNWTYQRSPNIFLPNINGAYRFSNWEAYFANTPNRVRIADRSVLARFPRV